MPRPKVRPVQFEGNKLARNVLRLLGWEVRFKGLPAQQGVIVIYPYTSNWDVLVGTLVRWSLGVPVRFRCPERLMRHPWLARWMREQGGVEVDRGAATGMVGDMVRQITEARARDELFWLVLSPEGTQALTEGWSPGFYRVAEEAKVPVGLATFDYVRRVVTLDAFIELSGNRTRDMALIAERMVCAHGFHPQNAAPIRLL